MKGTLFTIKIINGKLEYSSPKNDFKNFHGYFKLQKDPRGEKIEEENILLKNSFLTLTDWF